MLNESCALHPTITSPTKTLVFRYERGDNGSWSSLFYTLDVGVIYPAVIVVDMLDFQCEEGTTTTTTRTTTTSTEN